MKHLHAPAIAAAALAVGGVGYALGASAAQEPQDASAPPKPAAELKFMNQDLGTWNATVKVWMAPDAPPMEMAGTEVNKWDCHGMWMLTSFDAADGSFAGRAIGGWDPHQKKYVSVWADSWTPQLLMNRGTHDAASNTFHFAGEMLDQSTGKLHKTRGMMSYPDADTRLYTSWNTPPGGTETKSLEITYKRAK